MVKLQRGAQHPVSFVFAEMNGYRRIDLAHAIHVNCQMSSRGAMQCDA